MTGEGHSIGSLGEHLDELVAVDVAVLVEIGLVEERVDDGVARALAHLPHSRLQLRPDRVTSGRIALRGIVRACHDVVFHKFKLITY